MCVTRYFHFSDPVTPFLFLSLFVFYSYFFIFPMTRENNKKDDNISWERGQKIEWSTSIQMQNEEKKNLQMCCLKRKFIVVKKKRLFCIMQQSL